MTPPSKAEPQTNGDTINIQGIKIGGGFIRKTALGVAVFIAGGGGYSFFTMHNKEIESLKTRMNTVEKHQEKQEKMFLAYVQLTNPKVYRLLKELPE